MKSNWIEITFKDAALALKITLSQIVCYLIRNAMQLGEINVVQLLWGGDFGDDHVVLSSKMIQMVEIFL